MRYTNYTRQDQLSETSSLIHIDNLDADVMLRDYADKEFRLAGRS